MGLYIDHSSGIKSRDRQLGKMYGNFPKYAIYMNSLETLNAFRVVILARTLESLNRSNSSIIRALHIAAILSNHYGRIWGNINILGLY